MEDERWKIENMETGNWNPETGKKLNRTLGI